MSILLDSGKYIDLDTFRYRLDDYYNHNSLSAVLTVKEAVKELSRTLVSTLLDEDIPAHRDSNWLLLDSIPTSWIARKGLKALEGTVILHVETTLEPIRVGFIPTPMAYSIHSSSNPREYRYDDIYYSEVEGTANLIDAIRSRILEIHRRKQCGPCHYSSYGKGMYCGIGLNYVAGCTSYRGRV